MQNLRLSSQVLVQILRILSVNPKKQRGSVSMDEKLFTDSDRLSFKSKSTRWESSKFFTYTLVSREIFICEQKQRILICQLPCISKIETEYKGWLDIWKSYQIFCRVHQVPDGERFLIFFQGSLCSIFIRLYDIKCSKIVLTGLLSWVD